MQKRTRVAGMAVAGVLGMTALTGCAKFTEPFNDADISQKNDDPAEVYSFPDGFSNVASKCDEHGNRIFVVYHSDSPYGSVDVVPNDPSCKR